MSSSNVIPQGYTFMSPENFISEKSKAVILDLLEESHKRNPDAFNMYIYTDYHSHAIHNLIEILFTSIYSDIEKKNWIDAYHGIETLTIFFEFESTWTTCDDASLTQKTNNLYGALLLSILKGLGDDGNLSPQNIPNIEAVLRAAHTFAECMEVIDCKSPYGATCKAISKRLFQDNEAANRALFEARMREYAETVDESEKEEMLEDIEEYLEENEGTTWYLEGEVGSDEINDAPAALAKAWKEYKGSAPAVPLKGAPEWDLNKWTEEQKRPYSFDNPDAFDV